MDYKEFISVFGGAVELSPGIAGAVWSLRPFDTPESVVTGFEVILDSLSQEGTERNIIWPRNIYIYICISVCKTEIKETKMEGNKTGFYEEEVIKVTLRGGCCRHEPFLLSLKSNEDISLNI